MTDEEIKQRLFLRLKVIAPETEPENLRPEDHIRQKLGIDSFDFLQFIVAIDEEFEIQTPEEDYGKIDTIDHLLNYIKQRKNNTAVR